MAKAPKAPKHVAAGEAPKPRVKAHKVSEPVAADTANTNPARALEAGSVAFVPRGLGQIQPPPYIGPFAREREVPVGPKHRFLLTAGTHEEYGVKYDATKGKQVVIESPHELDVMFGSGKFRKLVPLAKARFLDEIDPREFAQTTATAVPGTAEAALHNSPPAAEGRVTAYGNDVTEQFRAAQALDLHVYQDEDGTFNCSYEGTEVSPVNPKPLASPQDVAAFLKTFAEGDAPADETGAHVSAE